MESDAGLLEDRWLRLNVRTGADVQAARDLNAAIVAAYFSGDRSYHTLDHIAALLDMLEGIHNRLEHPDAVEYAVWFHDIVYDTGRSDNEEASAVVAREAIMRLGLGAAMAADVAELVLSTKAHAASGSFDACYLIDADLSILGAAPSLYAEYAAAIRREFFWVDDVRYRDGRSLVLRHFLERDPIFLTDEFRMRFEAQAHVNLLNELRVLNAPSSAS